LSSVRSGVVAEDIARARNTHHTSHTHPQEVQEKSSNLGWIQKSEQPLDWLAFLLLLLVEHFLSRIDDTSGVSVFCFPLPLLASILFSTLGSVCPAFRSVLKKTRNEKQRRMSMMRREDD